MLNPPLSLLPDDLLACIVEYVAMPPSQWADLRDLSITDRAFTQLCQSHIFRILHLGYGSGNKGRITNKLAKMKEIVNHDPSFANRIRMVQLTVTHKQNTWLFNDPTFMSILQLLAKSPVPPHEIHLGGFMYDPFAFKDPVLVVGRFMQSFFSYTLTILHLTDCEDVPLPLFLICPGLKKVLLDHAEASEESYDTYPDNQCSDREAPTLESLNYRGSHSLVRHMITPPLRFRTPVVLWSKLCALTLSPHEEKELACLQPILDEACNSLEELYLTNPHVGQFKQFPLTGLVNLSGLSSLRVFSLYAIIPCVVQGSGVLHDINIVLGTIPASNRVTNLLLDFLISGKHPFGGCLDEPWVKTCNEVIRISGGKPLELDFFLGITTGQLVTHHPGEDELYARIMEETAFLSGCSEICSHFWNPTYWERGIAPLPRGQVRGRCRR